MSGVVAAVSPSPDRVFRETFLCRFDEEGAELFGRIEELLLAVAERRGFVPGRFPGRGRRPVPAKVLAVAEDLEHLVRYLQGLRHEPVDRVSPSDLALCEEALGWSAFLEEAVQALRREASGLPDEPP